MSVVDVGVKRGRKGEAWVVVEWLCSFGQETLLVLITDSV